MKRKDISLTKLESMINSGLSACKCADYFRVRPNIICRRLNEMGYKYNEDKSEWIKVNVNV